MSFDNYINQFYISHLDALTERKRIKFEYLNFSNLLPDQKTVQITLTIKISDTLIIKDKIDWDLNDDKKSVEKYSDILINHISPVINNEKLIKQNKRNITNQIYEQIITHLEKVNKIPKFEIIPKQSDINGLNELCRKCGTIQFNDIYCVNCYFMFDHKNTLTNPNTTNTFNSGNTSSTIPSLHPITNIASSNPATSINVNAPSNPNNAMITNDDNANLTERQRILQLRQKNINIDSFPGNSSHFNNSLSSSNILSQNMQGEYYYNINDSNIKKTCKKCGEVNDKANRSCKNCNYKFPIISCYNIYNNNFNYCVHFWDKMNKNHIIQQLKPFTSLFKEEDFSSLKYLYARTKEIIYQNYKDTLREEAYDELISFIDKIYNSFSRPSATSQKAFDTAYRAKYNKERPYNIANMISYNNLPAHMRVGFIPEIDVNINYKLPQYKRKQKVYDNIAKNNIMNLDDFYDDDINTNTNGDAFAKRKRGRPKKIEIFRDNKKPNQFGSEENEQQIILANRDMLLKNDIIIDDDLLHYDFCGKCYDAGKLICCETCSSAFHFECLGYDKFPRGKFKCYFCKIVKLGVEHSQCVTQKHIDLVNRLIQINPEFDSWFYKAEQLLEILKEHQCSCFFKEPIPKDIESFYAKIKEPRDLSLIEIKLKHWEYKTLKEFLKELRLIWDNIKEYYPPKSFFWRQADILEMLVNHLIKDEKVFDRFDIEKEIEESDITEYKRFKEKEKERKEKENEEKNKEIASSIEDKCNQSGNDINNNNSSNNNSNIKKVLSHKKKSKKKKNKKIRSLNIKSISNAIPISEYNNEEKENVNETNTHHNKMTIDDINITKANDDVDDEDDDEDDNAESKCYEDCKLTPTNDKSDK